MAKELAQVEQQYTQPVGVRQPALVAWLRLVRIFQRVDRATAEQLRAHDLSVAQFDVLAQLGLAEGISQQALADRLLVTKGNISQLTAKLERRGLIRRCQEGRAMALFLTPEGRRLREATVPAQEAVIARHFDALTAEEVRQLARLLRKVDQSLE